MFVSINNQPSSQGIDLCLVRIITYVSAWLILTRIIQLFVCRHVLSNNKQPSSLGVGLCLVRIITYVSPWFIINSGQKYQALFVFRHVLSSNKQPSSQGIGLCLVRIIRHDSAWLILPRNIQLFVCRPVCIQQQPAQQQPRHWFMFEHRYPEIYWANAQQLLLNFFWPRRVAFYNWLKWWCLKIAGKTNLHK